MGKECFIIFIEVPKKTIRRILNNNYIVRPLVAQILEAGPIVAALN